MKPLAPAFATVARHQQLPGPAVALGCDELRNALQQRIDAGVAGDRDLSAHAFPAKVRGIQSRGREEEVRGFVDCNSEVFLGPWVCAVVAAQARLDMRDGNACACSAQRPAESARSIALDDDEESSFDRGGDSARHLGDMRMRIRLPRAAELGQRESAQAEGGGIEARMLAGQDDAGNNAPAGERSCYG